MCYTVSTPGVLTYIRHMGMCHPNGCFSRDIPTHGSTFQRKNPQTWGPFFKMLGVCHQTFLKFLGVHSKSVKNWPIFQQKSLEMGTRFGINDPEMSMGFKTWDSTPLSKPDPSPHPTPPPLIKYQFSLLQELVLGKNDMGNDSKIVSVTRSPNHHALLLQ